MKITIIEGTSEEILKTLPAIRDSKERNGTVEEKSVYEDLMKKISEVDADTFFAIPRVQLDPSNLNNSTHCCTH